MLVEGKNCVVLAVRKVKKDMLELLKGRACENVPKCQEISGNVSLLQTNIHFNNVSRDAGNRVGLCCGGCGSVFAVASARCGVAT